MHIQKILKSCLLIVLLMAGNTVHAESTDSVQKKTTELETLKKKIQQIKSQINNNKKESSALKKKLDKSGAAIEKALQENKALDQKIQDQNQSLEKLKQQEKEKDTSLSEQKQALGSLLKNNYINGQSSPLSLLLMQKDLTLTNRHLIYQRYVSMAHQKKMDSLKKQLTDLSQIKKAIAFETNKLRLLQHEQTSVLETLQTEKKQTQQLISRLEKDQSKKDRQLSQYKKDASQLGTLITKLNKQALEQAKARSPFGLFSEYKGKLTWPTKGTLLHSFGTSRNGGALKWNGVLIKAPVGQKVTAISPGQVIFSDTFRNLGKLIILDHGNEYMSLYGYNQALHHAVGDKIKTGEVIASVGHHGNKTRSGLYFEIRQRGVPVNPALWCSDNAVH